MLTLEDLKEKASQLRSCDLYWPHDVLDAVLVQDLTEPQQLLVAGIFEAAEEVVALGKRMREMESAIFCAPETLEWEGRGTLTRGEHEPGTLVLYNLKTEKFTLEVRHRKSVGYDTWIAVLSGVGAARFHSGVGKGASPAEAMTEAEAEVVKALKRLRDQVSHYTLLELP